MTQHSFRKFRRRAQRQSDGVATGAESAQPLQQAAEDPSPRQNFQKEPAYALPSPLPSPWERMPRILFDPEQPEGAGVPLASACRGGLAGRGFDLLRTRLLQTLRARGWSRVGIAAPTSGCGTTFTAVNLALSLARVPSSRTILMDLNFRAPGLADAMGLAVAGDMTAFLKGATPLEQALIRPLDRLAVGVNTVRRDNAAEILHDSRSAAVLDELIERTQAETVLFDLPAILEYDDAAAFLPQLDGVLLISDGTQTTAAQLAACEGILAGHAPLLGVVLNRGRVAGSERCVA